MPLKIELKQREDGQWMHRVGSDPARPAAQAGGWWGPYRTEGIAKGAAKRRFRNRTDFTWVRV